MKEGLFSMFFSGKKENQFIEKITTLEDELEIKNLKINELKLKLESQIKQPKIKVDESEIFKKQLNIIQKNLNDRDLKNHELKTKLEKQLNEKNLLNEKITSLNSKLNKFKEEKNLLINKCQTTDTELIKISNENRSLKEINEELEEQINVLYSNKEVQSMGEITLPNTNILSMQNNNFKLPIELLFDSPKFESIVTLIRKDCNFIDELNLDVLTKKYGFMDHFDELSKLYIDYSNCKYNWNVQTYLLKGPKLTKVFQRQRKLLNLFKGLYFEFLLDLDDFNEELLRKNNFSSKQIESYQSALKEYSYYRLS